MGLENSVRKVITCLYYDNYQTKPVKLIKPLERTINPCESECPRHAQFGDISLQEKFLTDVLSIYNLIKLHPVPEIKNQNDDSIQKLLELPKAIRYLSSQKTKTLYNMIKGIKSLPRLVDRLSDQARPNSQLTVDSNSSSNELTLINSRKPPNSPREQSPNRPIALISPHSDSVQHIATVKVNSPRRSSQNIGTSGNHGIQNSSNISNSTQFQQNSNNSFNNSNLSDPMMVQNNSFPGDISLIRGPNYHQAPHLNNIPNQSTPYQQRPYTIQQVRQPIYNPPLNQPLNTAMPVRYVIRQVNQIPRPNISNGQFIQNQPPQYNQLFGSSFSSQASTPSPAPNQFNQPRPRITGPQCHNNNFQMWQNNIQIQNRGFHPQVPQRAVRPTMNNWYNNNMPLETQRISDEAERQVNETRKKWRNDETRPVVEFR